MLDVGVKLSGALETAHTSQVLHRDIKPANVLVDAYGEPQLADFGMARLAQATKVTRAGQITGTACYMAPEALDSNPSVSTDVFGLAATLHHALLGRATFQRSELLATCHAVLLHEPDPLGDLGVPQPVEEVLRQAMAKQPEGRPASAAAFADLLREAQQAIGVAPTRPVIRGRPAATTSAAPPSPPREAAAASTVHGQAPPAVTTSGEATIPIPGLEQVEAARHRWLTGDLPSAQVLLTELAADDDAHVAARARAVLLSCRGARRGSHTPTPSTGRRRARRRRGPPRTPRPIPAAPRRWPPR